MLGAAGSAFIAAYGALTNQSDQATGDLHFHQYPGVALDFLIVDLGVHYGFTPGGQDAASIIVAAPPGQPWSPSAAQTTCASFFPSDVQLLKQVKRVTVTQDGSTIGEDDIYRSATLATTFPASAFVDFNQNPVQAGSFDVQYLYTKNNNSNAIDSCELLVGTQQTS